MLALLAANVSWAAEAGTISGRVVDKMTGAPLRKVTLSLQGVGGGRAAAQGAFPIGAPGIRGMPPGGQQGRQTYGTRTDDQGVFRFEGLAPGSYTLIGERVGYIRQQFNPRGVSFSGTRIELRDGQQITGLLFKLSPQGVITGRVLDEDGDPLTGANLVLLRWSYVDGRRELTSAGSARVNDIGEFRIAQVPPGTYYLMAADNMGRGGPFQVEEEIPHVSTFYPRALDWSGATPLTVRDGEQISGVDVHMQRARVFSVRGTVVDSATNEPATGVALLLSPERGGVTTAYERRTSQTEVGGAFEIAGVLPGSYAITSRSRGRGPGGRGGRGNVEAEQSNGVAYQSIVVGEGDVNNVLVVLRPPLSLSGIITIDGDDSTTLPRLQISLTSDMGTGMYVARAEQDGAFEVSQLPPDRYHVSLRGLSANMYPKSLRYGDTEMLGKPLDLSGGVAGPVRIALSPNGAAVSGVVTDADDEPAGGVLVTVVPKGDGFQPDHLYKSVRTGLDGTFQVEGLAPGDYRIYAWEDLESGAERDPEFVRPFRDFGAGVSVKEGGSETVRMGLIPFEVVRPAQ